MKAISLFSGAGIGEFYLHRLGINVIAANEIVSKRAQTHSFFYPECHMINADITDANIQKTITEIALKNQIDIILATPPCQGLSSAGSNKTESSILEDPRNFLILSALNIIDKVQPKYVIIENVPRFQRMLFPYHGALIPLSELLSIKYSSSYSLEYEVLNAADYGVPQTRYRIVYRMWRKGLNWTLSAKEPQITLFEAIGDLPSLEAGESSSIKNHFSKPHPSNHVECMKYTPTGKSAFSNTEHYPKKSDGTRIVGYPNTYKRMRWDIPAPTITMRNEIVSSQENVHPGRPLPDNTWSDARVLTLRELLIVSSLPPDLDPPPFLTETAFRQLIGEGIPPLMLEKIMKGITDPNEYPN